MRGSVTIQYFSFLRLFTGLYVILGGSMRAVKENIEALLVASKENGLRSKC